MRTVLVPMVAIVAVLAGAMPATAQPVPALSPDTQLDFGEVPYLQSTTAQFQVLNLGDEALIVSSVVSSNAAEFPLSVSPFAVDPGDSQSVTITYDPISIGFDTTTVTVTSLNSPAVLELLVVGQAIRNSPRIDVSTDSIGVVLETGGVRDVTFRIANTGGDILSWTLEETPDQGWLNVYPGQGSGPWMVSQEVHAVFDADELPVAPYSAELVITSNDFSNPEVRIPVTMFIETGPAISVTPVSVSMGLVREGDSVRTDIVVRNAGGGVLDVTGVTATSPRLLPEPFAPSIPALERDTLTVTFAAVDLGPFSGEVRIHSDDPLDPEVAVTFTATVVDTNPPVIDVPTDPIVVDLTTSQTETVVLPIHNIGSIALEWEVFEEESEDPLPTMNVLVEGDHLNNPLLGSDVFFDALTSDGVTTIANLGEITKTKLSGYDVLFLTDFGQPLNATERVVVRDFVAAGGGLLYDMPYEPTEFDILMNLLGAGISGNDGLFAGDEFITNLADHPTTTGLNKIHVVQRDNWLSVSEPAQWLTKYGNDLIHSAYADIGGRVAAFATDAHLNQSLAMSQAENLDFMRNVFAWLANGVAWLELDPLSGVTQPGAFDSLYVNFDATDLYGGAYTADIVIRSNAPLAPEVRIPATLNITPAPLISLSSTSFEFDGRALGDSDVRYLGITNNGTEPLVITAAFTDSASFQAGSLPPPIEPDSSYVLDVTFTPLEEGQNTGTLYIVSNAFNADTATVALSGPGAAAFDVDISPDTLAVTLGPSGWESADVFIVNNAVIEQPVAVSLYGTGDTASRPATRRADPPTETREMAEWETFAAPPVADPPAAPSAANGVPAVYDNFEDRDFDEWTVVASASSKEFGSLGSRSQFAFREVASQVGHGNGIYRTFPAVRPTHIAFDVKPARSDMYANYVTFKDANGQDVIFFFASGTQQFYLSDGAGSNLDVAYTPGRWYRIEFRNIDWTANTFDYYVDGRLVQDGVLMRNYWLERDISRVDLYSYSEGATAWWDNVWMTWGTKPSWLSVLPRSTSVAPANTKKLQAQFAAAGVAPGPHDATLALRTNNPDAPILEIPVTLTVDSLLTAVGDGDTPRAWALRQNYPNPFNPVTRIAYDLRDGGDVTLVVYDVRGAVVRRLVSATRPAGRYAVDWDGTNEGGERVSSGVYFYRLTAGSFDRTRKMVLLK